MNPTLYFRLVLKRKKFVLDMEGTVNPGITGVFGPSGSGKTTLLHAIAGVVKPDSGEMIINSIPIYNSKAKIYLPAKDRKIGYVFQDHRLFPHLSVENNLRYGMKNGQSTISFGEVIDILEIGHLLTKRSDECSGGERQRIAIGRALLSSPQILIMDEPFSSFEVRLRGNIIPYLIRINQKYSLPILVVSHDLPDLLQLTNSLILVSEGKIIGQGKYIDLILNEKCCAAMVGAGLLNVFHSEVLTHQPTENNSVLEVLVGQVAVGIVCEPCLLSHKPGSYLTVSLRPQDISISMNHVSNISIQNQLPGKIKHIIDSSSHVLCLVDVGFDLLVEVTYSAALQLGLCPGMSVYCLFKSVSMQVHRI